MPANSSGWYCFCFLCCSWSRSPHSSFVATSTVSSSDPSLPQMTPPASVRWIPSLHMHDRTFNSLLLLLLHGFFSRYFSLPFSKLFSFPSFWLPRKFNRRKLPNDWITFRICIYQVRWVNLCLLCVIKYSRQPIRRTEIGV